MLRRIQSDIYDVKRGHSASSRVKPWGINVYALDRIEECHTVLFKNRSYHPLMLQVMAEGENGDVTSSRLLVEGRTTLALPIVKNGEIYLFIFNPEGTDIGRFTLYTAFNISH
jgi:hypothetical protein